MFDPWSSPSCWLKLPQLCAKFQLYMGIYFSHHCYFTISPKVHCMMGTPKLSELGAHCQFTMPTMLAAFVYTSAHGSCVCLVGLVEIITLVALPTLQCWLVTAVWTTVKLLRFVYFLMFSHSRCWYQWEGGGCIIKCCSSVPVHMYTPHRVLSQVEQLKRLVVRHSLIRMPDEGLVTE